MKRCLYSCVACASCVAVGGNRALETVLLIANCLNLFRVIFVAFL